MTIPRLPACMCCAHLKRDSIGAWPKITCEAFPKGIPEPIVTVQVEHLTPYEGDGGIVFEQAKDRAPAYVRESANT